LMFQSSTVPLVPVIRTSMIAPSSKEGGKRSPR
jgi:hypothetical protein